MLSVNVLPARLPENPGVETEIATLLALVIRPLASTVYTGTVVALP